MKSVGGAGRLFLPSRLLCLAGIVLIVMTIGAARVTSGNLRDEAVARSREEMRNLGIVLASETERSMAAVDIVLQEVRAQANAASAGDPDQFARLMGTENVHRFLEDRLRNLPQAQAIGVIGADGRMVNTSSLAVSCRRLVGSRTLHLPSRP